MKCDSDFQSVSLVGFFFTEQGQVKMKQALPALCH